MEPITFRPIGTIRTPFAAPEGMPVQPHGALGVRGSIALLPELAEGLKDLDGFSHLLLFYHFHRAAPARLRVVPFLDTAERGIFATRAPARPNAIGVSVVELLAIRDSVLEIANVDMLDGTPLLDIKPYVPSFDHWPTTAEGWMQQRGDAVPQARADGRFGQ